MLDLKELAAPSNYVVVACDTKNTDTAPHTTATATAALRQLRAELVERNHVGRFTIVDSFAAFKQW